MRNRFKLLTFKKRSIIKFIFIYIPIIITLNILVKIFPLPIYLLYPMITILLIGTTYIHLKHIKNIEIKNHDNNFSLINKIFYFVIKYLPNWKYLIFAILMNNFMFNEIKHNLTSAIGEKYIKGFSITSEMKEVRIGRGGFNSKQMQHTYNAENKFLSYMLNNYISLISKFSFIFCLYFIIQFYRLRNINSAKTE